MSVTANDCASAPPHDTSTMRCPRTDVTSIGIKLSSLSACGSRAKLLRPHTNMSPDDVTATEYVGPQATCDTSLNCSALITVADVRELKNIQSKHQQKETKRTQVGFLLLTESRLVLADPARHRPTSTRRRRW